jgi:lipopolysaccharide export system permease protein
MKLNSIINRYIIKEMVPPFLINTVFFTFVFLMTKILEITNLVVNYRINLSSVILMLFYSMPQFLEFVIPMSVMMTVLLTFLKLSGDNEIIALKAGGISPYRMLVPVLIFCLVGFVLTGMMTVYGVPWGRLSFKKLAREAAASSVNIGLKERTFSDSFHGVMLYLNKIDMTNKDLIDVFIEDQRDENRVSAVVAPKGRLFFEPGKMAWRLRLYNGTVNRVDLSRKSVDSINFVTYDINLDMGRASPSAAMGPKGEKEMGLGELVRFIRNSATKGEQYYSALITFHRKISIPFACFSLGILSLPLGIQSRQTRKAFGLGLGLFSFFFYYLLLSLGKVFGETGAYPPAIGMWMPNIVTAALGIYLFVRVANERPVQTDALWNFIKRMKPAWGAGP